MGETYNSMTFFRSYWDALRTLPEADRVKMYDAIMGYALDGIEPDLDGYLVGMFMLLRPNIDNSQKLRNSQGRGKKKPEEEEPEKKVSKRYGKGTEKVGKTYEKGIEKVGETYGKGTENLGKTERERDKDRDKDGDIERETESDSHNVMAEDKEGIGGNNVSVYSGGTEPAEQTHKAPKRPYGEFKNVMLSVEEARKLIEKFPTDWQKRIEALSSYKKSKGRKYKDDYATIVNWGMWDQKPKGGNKKNGDIEAYCQEMADWAERTETIQEGDKPPNE